MPRPPPPAIALIIIGSPPSESKNASASSTVVAPSVPSRIGTPHRLAMARATDLSPSAASAAGDGPTKISPCSAQRAAKLACSLRKPYPGCTAVATRTHRDVDDLLGIEVRRRASTAQRDGRVGAADGERVRVVLGVDGHGAHAEVGGGPDDPDCHLSSVRDEDAGPGFERGPHRSAWLRRW